MSSKRDRSESASNKLYEDIIPNTTKATFHGPSQVVFDPFGFAFGYWYEGEKGLPRYRPVNAKFIAATHGKEDKSIGGVALSITRGFPPYTADASADYGMLYVVRFHATSTGGDVVAKWSLGPETSVAKKMSTDGSQATIPVVDPAGTSVGNVGGSTTGAVAGATVARTTPHRSDMTRSRSSSQLKDKAPTLPPINPHKHRLCKHRALLARFQDSAACSVLRRLPFS